MDDDLNTSAALAVLHDVMREGNTALAGGDLALAGKALAEVRAMLNLLGLDPQDAAFTQSGTGELRGTVDALVALALEQRAAARGRKDWAAADAVRDQLKQAGVVVEDTPHGARWTIGSEL
jgi:cysteinyl-tRNA synthetase